MRQAKDLISILEEAHQVVPEELIEMANMAKNHMSSMLHLDFLACFIFKFLLQHFILTCVVILIVDLISPILSFK